MGLESELNDSARGSTSNNNSGGGYDAPGMDYGGSSYGGMFDGVAQGSSPVDFSGDNRDSGNGLPIGVRNPNPPEFIGPINEAPENDSDHNSGSEFDYYGPGVDGYGTPMDSGPKYTMEDFTPEGSFVFADKEMMKNLGNSFETAADYIASVQQANMLTSEELNQFADDAELSRWDKGVANGKLLDYELRHLTTSPIPYGDTLLGSMAAETIISLSGLPIPGITPMDALLGPLAGPAKLAIKAYAIGAGVLGNKVLGGTDVKEAYATIGDPTENSKNSDKDEVLQTVIAGLDSGQMSPEEVDEVKRLLGPGDLGALPEQKTVGYGQGLLSNDSITTNVYEFLSNKDRGYTPFKGGF